MKNVMLACGCAANAVNGKTGKPSCVIHDCEEEVKGPDLTEREAKCGYCKTIVKSSMGLAFFEFKGEGSRHAQEQCKNCMYHLAAHDPEVMKTRVPGNRETVVETGECKGFEPAGPAKYDSYYCGCRGWD